MRQPNHAVIKAALVVGGLLSMVACRKAAVAGLNPVLPAARLYYDDSPPQGQFRDSLRLVVRDEAAWRDVWTRATAAQTTRPAQPAIDFERELVLVVGAGRLRAGDQIRVDSAGNRGKFFVAVVRTILECQSFPADAYPLEIVRIAYTKQEVTFDDRRERSSACQQ